jgi:hypothetical protein
VREGDRDLEEKLEKLGYESRDKGGWIEMELGQDQRKKLTRALEKMPPLLAVHVAMNREGFSDWDVLGQDIPSIIGLEGKPHSGKTMGLILFLKSKFGEVVRAVDFDPFSNQSLDWNKSKLEGVDPTMMENNPSGVQQKIHQVFQQQKPEMIENKGKIRLGDVLDGLIGGSLEGNFLGVEAVLGDLPGEDERTESWDILQLIRHIIPTINMDRENATERPLIDLDGHAEIYVMIDKIRSELGGLQRYHQIKLEETARIRAKRNWNIYKGAV